MLSALGKLNSELLTMYYGDEPTPPQRVAACLREANLLLRQAHANLHVAIGQDLHATEEAGLANTAATGRHVARHTIQPNSMCTGPCVHIPRHSVQAIRRAAEGLHGPDRAAAINRLAAALQVTGSQTDPRLCSIGIPCAAARFQESNDVANLEQRVASREKIATQILKEAKYTRHLANMVAKSRVRELEAEDSTFQRIDLAGGGVRLSDRDSVKHFFREHQLGPPPDTGDIRVALNDVLSSIRPHARTRVKTDLWSRWLNL